MSQLSIRSLRNVNDATLFPSDGINIIIGENGSGKTSILEAIHLLALGKSFRTRTLKSVVQFGQPQLQVIAKTISNIPIGLQFSILEGLSIRLNNAPLKRLSELASQLPLQFIPANSHHFFEQGPKYRRQLIDWGLFHVEPSFNFHWQAYKKILQQRNSALRQHKKREEVQLWDEHLTCHGEAITQLRRKQLDKLLVEFKKIFSNICPTYKNAQYEVKYREGWLKGETLSAALEKSIQRDELLGYTRSGSHAADWSFRINNFDPADVFSRGQQKLFSLALCMAQAKMAEHVKHDKTILLLDDLSSELDKQHQQKVIEELGSLTIQTFITTTEIDVKPSKKYTVFHVEQGTVRQQDC
ncbi:DNA replication/repair protein RecF [Pseudomonadota bacterium]|nr:DNA replication/repair protein RecF [Pseudomonadota bacterium]